MKITKAASAAPSGAPDAAQLEKINALARGTLKAEDVYVFSVILCDDRPDRDFERFDTAALGALAELFRGKTGVMDHDWSAEKQVARIFDTELIPDGPATAIRAWCYSLRSEETLVAEIEAGIKKEVSVGCAMGSKRCSICGAPYGQCEHRKGERYGTETCLAILSDPVDAYEFSFVAVPAQRAAGVRKGYADTDEQRLLEKQAQLGREYLAGLRSEITALATQLETGLDEALLCAMTRDLEAAQLKQLKAALQNHYERRYPPRLQLTPHRQTDGGIEPEYRI